jgi:hypothetical protein
MTRTEVDYNTNETVIYKIYCLDTNVTYVYFGSTTNFRSRKWAHKSACNNENNKQHNINLYKTIRDNGGFDNFEMVLVEVYPCESKKHLLIREQFHIDQQIDKMNSVRAYSSVEDNKERDKQYNLNNKDKISEYKKQYRADNKDKIVESKKQYHLDNKDTIKEYKKQYHSDNKIIIDAKTKQYYLDNKIKIAERKRLRYLATKKTKE